MRRDRRNRRGCGCGNGIGAAWIVSGVVLVLVTCPEPCLLAMIGCALCVIGGVFAGIK